MTSGLSWVGNHKHSVFLPPCDAGPRAPGPRKRATARPRGHRQRRSRTRWGPPCARRSPSSARRVSLVSRGAGSRSSSPHEGCRGLPLRTRRRSVGRHCQGPRRGRARRSRVDETIRSPAIDQCSYAQPPDPAVPTARHCSRGPHAPFLFPSFLTSVFRQDRVRGCAICKGFASPRVTLPPHYSSFTTNTHIDSVISFASKVVALMNVLAARRKKLLPIEKGTDPTLSH